MQYVSTCATSLNILSSGNFQFVANYGISIFFTYNLVMLSIVFPNYFSPPIHPIQGNIGWHHSFLGYFEKVYNWIQGCRCLFSMLIKFFSILVPRRRVVEVIFFICFFQLWGLCCFSTHYTACIAISNV